MTIGLYRYQIKILQIRWLEHAIRALQRMLYLKEFLFIINSINQAENQDLILTHVHFTKYT